MNPCRILVDEIEIEDSSNHFRIVFVHVLATNTECHFGAYPLDRNRLCSVCYILLAIQG